MAKKTVNKKKNRRTFTKLLSFINVMAAALLLIQIFNLNLLPMKYFILVTLLVVILVLLVLLISNFKGKNAFTRLLVVLLAMAMTVGLCVGNFYVYKTGSVFQEVTQISSKKAHTTSVIVLADNGASDIKDLEGNVVGILTKQDKGQKRVLKQLNKYNVTTVSYDNVFDLIDALKAGSINAMVMNENLRGIVHEQDGYYYFNTETKNIYQDVYYTKRKATDNASDSVSDITSDAFTILISGNDSYGTLEENARSDANMLLTVNPKTHRILIVNIPRDYYVDMVCNDNACPEGAQDKLTHTGLHGVKSVEKSLENALGITINYNIQINFSSVTNLVDAMGGIDLDITEEDACDSFYTNATLPGLSVGHHENVNGETALAFARERYSYATGDNQRVKNQQKVFKAMLKKALSASMITNYSKFMDALSVAFNTNLSDDEIASFVRYELNELPKWKIESYAISADSSTEFCYEAQSYASVTLQDEYKNKIARKKIQAILDGKKAKSVKDSTEVTYSSNSSTNSYDYNTYTPDTYDNSYSYDNSYDYSYDDNTYDNSSTSSDDYYYDDSQNYYDDSSQGYDQGYTYDDNGY